MTSSYRRYREYRTNCYQFKMDQLTAPIVMMLIIGFLTKYGWVLIGCIAAFAIMQLWRSFSACNTKKGIIEKTVRVENSKEETQSMKTTENGYLNRNNQRNNGRTNKPGTDFGQWYYEMECMNCGHKYNANGTDIWQRKCPKCQGGRP